jgi:hypothetical protein
VIVGTTHIERIRAFEPKHDSVLVVHAHRVPAPEVTRERVRVPPTRRLLLCCNDAHRVDAHRTQRRRKRGSERNHHNRDDHQDEREWIRRTNAE